MILKLGHEPDANAAMKAVLSVEHVGELWNDPGESYSGEDGESKVPEGEKRAEVEGLPIHHPPLSQPNEDHVGH